MADEEDDEGLVVALTDVAVPEVAAAPRLLRPRGGMAMGLFDLTDIRSLFGTEERMVVL